MKNFLIGLGLTTLTVVVLQLLIIGFGIELTYEDRAASIFIIYGGGVGFSIINLIPRDK